MDENVLESHRAGIRGARPPAGPALGGGPSVPHADPHVRAVTIRIVQTRKLGLGDRGLGQGRSPGLGPGAPDAEAQVARSVPGKRAGTRRDGHRR